MKTCYFCLENIYESAEACSHCGQWQPSLEEVNYTYKKVAAKIALNKMGITWFGPLILSFVLVIVARLIPILKGKMTFITLIVSAFFLSLFLIFNLFRQYLDKTIFEEAVKIDQLLHISLKELQIRKSQSYARMLVIIVCMLLIIFIIAKILRIL